MEVNGDQQLKVNYPFNMALINHEVYNMYNPKSDKLFKILN